MNVIKKHKLAILFLVLIGFSIPANLFAQVDGEFGMLANKVRYNDISAVKELIASGADINHQQERYGHTPLIIACNYNYKELAKFLISKGADINIRGKDGSSALIAAGSNSQELVELLLSKGADVNAKTKNGATALSIVVKEGHQKIINILKSNGAK